MASWSILRLSKKIDALKNILNSSDSKELFSTFKRVANIVKDVDIDSDLSIDESLFESEAEKSLYKRYLEVTSKKYDDYESMLDSYFSLKSEIDRFFDNVMVNVEDEKIKTNRKNLIAQIYKSFRDIADIKEITAWYMILL